MALTPQRAANTLAITETRLAASLRALGFPYTAETTIHERTGAAVIQFLFGLSSLRFPALKLPQMLQAWRSGEMAREDPLHVLHVMMTAHECYDALLRMMKDHVSHCLHLRSGGVLTVYRPGAAAPPPGARLVWTNDLNLAAACGVVGVPVLSIDGSAGQHRFGLAPCGYRVLLSDGGWQAHDTATLIARDPVREDEWRLRMEATQPLHPLCLAYDALHNRAQLKAELKGQGRAPMILIDEPARVIPGAHKGACLAVRQALGGADAPGHVMDQVPRHMQAPPMSW